MKIILLTRKHHVSKSAALNWGLVLATLMLLIMIPAVTGYFFGIHRNWVDASMLPKDFAQQWQNRIKLQDQKVNVTLQVAEDQFKALTLRVAELQARLVRLDALGERLIDSSDLRQEEFDFSKKPALGGPDDADLGTAYEPPSFLMELGRLADEIESREQQLAVLQSLMTDRKINEDVFISGRPVVKGWMSSRYGRRTDPFTGRLAWHKGVDFAGKEGTDIIAVAAGVVTKVGSHSGYGELVEINHGQGYVTRYAHCKEVFVKVGDVVRRNQVISSMGSTGRSTGPHVHFEVLRNGRHVDPSRYVNRSKKI